MPIPPKARSCRVETPEDRVEIPRHPRPCDSQVQPVTLDQLKRLICRPRPGRPGGERGAEPHADNPNTAGLEPEES
jgi:hypothetical protein